MSSSANVSAADEARAYPRRGVVYVAPRQDLLDEARISIRSLKRSNPGIHAILYTDLVDEEAGFDEVRTPPMCRTGYMDKVVAMPDTPYEETLFLDSDTYVVSSLEPVFDLLERHDLAAARSTGPVTVPTEGIPPAFAEFNTGVIAFRDNDAIRAFFDAWKREYKRLEDTRVPRLTDQPAFRNALYRSGLHFYQLGAEYNCRIPFSGFLNAPVAVLHGRDRSLLSLSLRKLFRNRGPGDPTRAAERFFDGVAKRLNRRPHRPRVHWTTLSRGVAARLGGLKVTLYHALRS